jgi:DNA invertase Pin-like site-specific DNA recombinase
MSEPRIIGYARVSTKDQDLAIQRKALKQAGAETVYDDTASGTTTDGRFGLLFLRTHVLRKGDTLLVTRIDRLARSIADLSNLVRDLQKKGVHLRATEQPIDTSSAAGKAFLDMLGVFAEFETNLRKERQLEGIAKAKAEGVYKGRKASIDADRIKELVAAGKGASEIAKELKIGRASVYRYLLPKKVAG